MKPQFGGAFALQTIVAMVLALIAYTIVCAIVFVACFIIYRVLSIIRPEIIEIMGAVIGSVVGMYAARLACDATLRDYSGKAVCIFFEIIFGVAVISVAIDWSDFTWSWMVQITHAFVAAPAAFILFWNRTAEPKSLVGKLTIP
ncbi:MAG: hypothetical protein WBD42_07255 [Methylovirgula sp.]